MTGPTKNTAGNRKRQKSATVSDTTHVREDFMSETKSKEFIVRTSQRSDYNRCRQKEWWAYVDLLKPQRVSPPLRFGDLIHQALAVYYRPSKPGKVLRGVKPWITFDKLYVQQLEDGLTDFNIRLEDDEKWIDARALGNEMLRNYVERYGRDERYRIIAPEQAFQVDLYTESGLYICTYVGQLDAVVQDMETKYIGLFEHKTAASIQTEHLDMDEQAGTYWAVAPFYLEQTGVLKPGEDLDFIMYNFLRKAGKDTRPQNAEGQYLNQNGSVSKKQPPPLFKREKVFRGRNDRIALLQRIEQQVAEMKLVHEGVMPHFKNIMGGCRGMFGCEYRDMCTVHESGGDWESVRDATMTTWDPYAAHELEQEKYNG